VVRAASLVVIVAAAVAGTAACTPKDTAPEAVKYDGPVAEALAAIAKDCRAIGIAKDQPLAQASDFTCTAPDAEMTLHLDTKRRVRSILIRLVAPDTETARTRLDAALTPVLDVHHRTNVLGHLDDPIPGGVSPIPQLSLEDHLYQVASEPVDGGRRYVFKVRIN
jgi:hypothetical protein